MVRWQKLATIVILAVLVALPFALVPVVTPRDRAAAADEPRLPSGQRWSATAPGKIEPLTGDYRVSTAVAGRIVDVLAQAGDKVSRGDLLVRLDDQKLLARIAAATADVSLKKVTRDDQGTTARTRRRYDADDAVFTAEQRQLSARTVLDRVVTARRQGSGGDDEVAEARTQLRAAEAEAARTRAIAADVRASQGTPDPNVNETALSMARSQLAALQAMLDQTRIRAPIDGTVLSISAKLGEIAAPSVPEPLLMVGDLTKLRVRTEVDGRDLAKVRNGQRAVVRADAFATVEFPGYVTSVAPALAPGKLSPRGPRRTGEAEVLEVIVTLDGEPPLLPGLKVDVFFADEQPQASGRKP